MRGRVVGTRRGKLREDDPLRGKYVNTPEGELFLGSILYGLHLAKAIGKDFAAVVGEPYSTRSTGWVQPAVASIGTALTERQLREPDARGCALFAPTRPGRRPPAGWARGGAGADVRS